MPSEETLKIISVTGAHSRVGKTTLCSILLKNLRGFGAIKYTKTSEHRRQRTEHPLPYPPPSRGRAWVGGTPNSLLIDNITILNEKGKDTAIFLESGAERVLWIQSPYNELENILHTAMDRMAGLKGVIIEGNSPVDFVTPSLIIFIIELEGEIKPSAVKVSKKADIIIINAEKNVKELPFLATISIAGKKVFRIDLRKKKGEIGEFLSFVKERIT